MNAVYIVTKISMIPMVSNGNCRIQGHTTSFADICSTVTLKQRISRKKTISRIYPTQRLQHSFPMLVREGGDPLQWHHSGFILNQEAIQEGRDWSQFSRWSWWPRRSRWPWWPRWPRRPWHQAWRPGAGDTGPVAHLVCHGYWRRSRGPKA